MQRLDHRRLHAARAADPERESAPTSRPSASAPAAPRAPREQREVREPREPRSNTGRGGGGTRDRGDRGSRGGSRAGLEAPLPKLTEEDFRSGGRGESAPAPARAPRSGRDGAAAGSTARRRPDSRPEGRSSGSGERRGQDRERRRRDDEPEVEPDINAEEVDFAAHVVDDLLRLLDIDAELTIREPLTAGDGRGASLAVIDITGDDLGLLIGRRGDTLLSMQYLVNLIVQRRFPDRPGVNIDVEHYRHRREEQVMALAQRMADRVRETGSPITLEPMSAAERRLIHIALADDPELETNSVGEGENRKVVISARQ